jgi:hypothetical protein
MTTTALGVKLVLDPNTSSSVIGHSLRTLALLDAIALHIG